MSNSLEDTKEILARMLDADLRLKFATKNGIFASEVDSNPSKFYNFCETEIERIVNKLVFDD